MTTERLLPSWREGDTRNAVLDFLDAAADIPPELRLAVFDNDGTLWCEKPHYAQLDFFVWQLAHSVGERPELRDVPEFAAVLSGDMATIPSGNARSGSPTGDSLRASPHGWRSVRVVR